MKIISCEKGCFFKNWQEIDHSLKMAAMNGTPTTGLDPMHYCPWCGNRLMEVEGRVVKEKK